jgi:phospholipid/cholesterol/gamma-HCH transport system substrate-binding protein
MTSSPNKRAVTVGIFIFLGIVFLVVGIMAIGNVRKTFVKTIMVTAVFDDVEGLKIGNNVWFSGVKVGTVKRMEFVDKSQVKVTIRIEENAGTHIRKDAKAKISSEGLIGNKIIVLYGGSESVPPVEDGDAIVVEKTTSTEEMMNTLEESNKNLKAITDDVKVLTGQMREGQGTLGKLLQDSALYLSLNATMASLQAAATNAQRLSASLAQFGNNLNQPGTFANDLVTDTTLMPRLRSTVSELNAVAENANQVTNDIKAATSDPTTPVGVMLHDQETARSLKATIQNLETSSKTLDEDLKALQHNFLLRGYFKKKNK